MDKTILTSEHYRYLIGQLTVDKIPHKILNKIYCGDDFTLEEEQLIIEIIEEDRR